MVAASGPTGILAGRPTATQAHSQYMQNGTIDTRCNGKQKSLLAEEDRLRHQSDLYIRPSWTDAAIALDQLEKGKAEGQRSAVWIRARLQDQLSQLGYFLQRHAGKVLFVAILVLATFIVALKSVQVHTKVEQLWIQEGGRLEKELAYAAEALGEPAPSIDQLVIQTPKHSGANILHPTALKEHLAILKTATQVTVDLFEITWKLKDMCSSPDIPNFDMHYIDQIFDSIIPCSFITPLDCFWEGSKLLGPDYPVQIPGLQHQYVRWTNLNPIKLFEQMKRIPFVFPFKTLEDYMKRSGITNGYQSKPCLDPFDPECPDTAPNKKSRQIPDVGAELTGGCYGFAANHMHWPEDVLVGGAKHNKTGHLTRAAALQTVVQLTGPRELYDLYASDYKVHHIDWSQEKAAQVLETWQRAFAKAIKKQVNASGSALYNSYAFSTTTMNDVLGKYSEVSVRNIAIGCGLMLLYAGFALLRWNDPVRSQAGVAIAGVLLSCATVAAGLGFCALLGIPFNAVTTQILPFLTLGLSVHDMFLLTHTYAELSVNEVPSGEQTAVVLKRTGLSVLLKGLCIVCAFFAAAIIPIPVLRVFTLQAGILILFNLAAMLLVFPTMVSLDLRRRRSGRSDILCCCLPALTNDRNNHRKSCNTARQTITRAIPPDRRETRTQVLTNQNDGNNESWVGGNIIDNDYEKHCSEEDTLTGCTQDECLSFSLTKFAARHYAPFIIKPSTKVFGMMLLACVLAGSVWQSMRVNDGLQLTDLVPHSSDEYSFLAAQAKHFGFYNMYAVTGRDFEYPNNQKLLYEYHDAFMRVKNVIKNDDGGLPKFWLSLFRDWLKGLQLAFDKEYRDGCFTQEGWFKNASDEAILAYKLLVQTGHVDNPIDKTLINQVRLVDSEGIINPRAFYNYLSAWAHNDALAYGASQGQLRPQPREWIFTNDHELKIQKSLPLTYAQMPFHLHRLTDTNEITELIASVRKVCKKFEERGLPNFPSGIPFLYWEQYMDLRSCLGIALLAALGASIAVVGILLLNLWAALLVGTSLAGVVLQLFGVMGLAGMQLSAVSAVLLVVSVGISVHFTVHICLSFITSVGSRDRRVRLSLEHMFAPIIHGAVTTLLSVVMLAFSEFEFIVRYFFLVLLCLIGIGLVNGLFFFPILLSLVGPSPEVIPHDHPDRISTPTPPPSPIVRRSKPPAPPRRPHKIDNRSLHTEPSLTTITEEPNSWHSTQESCIIVQPEVKVETTSTCGNQNCGGSDSSGSSRTSPVPSTPHITTKVTATANIKVEVHTPLTIGGVDRGEKCRHSSSGSRRSTRCTANINTESSNSSSEPVGDSGNVKH